MMSSEKIVEVFSSNRESVVRNQRDFYPREIGKLRFSLVEVSAESAFLPWVSKYVIETAVVLDAILIGSLNLFYNMHHMLLQLWRFSLLLVPALPQLSYVCNKNRCKYGIV